MDIRKWICQERDLNVRSEPLKNTVDKYKQEMQKLKEECYVSALLQVMEKVKEKDLAASILVEQVQNFAKKKPMWSEVTVRHAVVLLNLSTRAYEHVRSTGILRLPKYPRALYGLTTWRSWRDRTREAKAICRARFSSLIASEGMLFYCRQNARQTAATLSQAKRCLHRRGGLWCELPQRNNK